MILDFTLVVYGFTVSGFFSLGERAFDGHAAFGSIRKGGRRLDSLSGLRSADPKSPRPTPKIRRKKGCGNQLNNELENPRSPVSYRSRSSPFAEESAQGGNLPPLSGSQEPRRHAV